jgi:glycosyltransferase involved in cell wall biosynthesis
MGNIIFRKEVSEQLEKVGEADILIGIPSFNNARTIGHVVKAVQAGLEKYFPDKKSVLVNSDGGSTDETTTVVNNTVIEDYSSILVHHRVEPVFKIVTPYIGIPGKGSAFRAIFEIANALKVKACAVVDSDLRSITPEWVELLVKPILAYRFDYVAPLYRRHKYDGTITNSIIYPLTRALYGKRVRQPIGGDFGFSGKLLQFYLSKDVWQTDIARYGIDIWMTTEALANGFKIAQSFLGAKIHDPKDPGSDLSAMLAQVVGSCFSLMVTYKDIWKQIQGSENTPSFGFYYAVEPEYVKVNVNRMLGMFRDGVKGLREIWRSVLGAGDLSKIETMAMQADTVFNFSTSLWTQVIYDYALAYRKRTLPLEHLLKSLTPLYLGWTASFILQVENLEPQHAEEVIEKLCLEFEENKSYVVSNWI